MCESSLPFTVIESATIPSVPSPSITAATAMRIMLVDAEPAPPSPPPTIPTDTAALSANTCETIDAVEVAVTRRSPAASMLVRVVVALTTAGELVRLSCVQSEVSR